MSRDDEPLLTRITRMPGRLAERVAEIGAAIAAAIEAPFERLGRGMLSASERVERVDSLVTRLARLVAWPFMMIWRAAVWLFELVLPESARQVLMKPVHGASNFLAWLGGVLWGWVEALNLDGLVRWIVWLLTPLWRPVAAVVGFLIAWLSTRNYKQLLWGLPAAMVVVPLLIGVSWRWVLGNEGVANMYRVASKKATEDKDIKTSSLFDRKLAQLGVDTKVADYRTALALSEQGKYKQAYRRMARLAPLDEPSFPAAHGWIIQQAFAGRLGLPPDEARDLAGKHLDAIDHLGIDSSDVKFLRAHWLSIGGRREEAIKKLAPLVLQMPEAALASMQIHVDLKQFDKARDDARALRNHLMKRRQKVGEFNQAEVQWWALAEEVLGNDEELVKALTAWLKFTPDEPRAKLALSEVYRRQFERQIFAATPSVDRLYRLLCDAARHPASRQWAEAQVNGIMLARASSTAAAQLAERLKASDATPPVLIEAMGTWYALQRQSAEARVLLKRSLDADPANAIGWNNYGWALSVGDEADLDAALAAVGKAIELLPREFRFRETRGQIYAQMKKWPEAIADLELALNGMPDLPAIHATLAKAYDATGEQELADVHRRQAR